MMVDLCHDLARRRGCNAATRLGFLSAVHENARRVVMLGHRRNPKARMVWTTYAKIVAHRGPTAERHGHCAPVSPFLLGSVIRPSQTSETVTHGGERSCRHFLSGTSDGRAF